MIEPSDMERAELPETRAGYTRPQHIVNISGGKDSASCYMLAMMRGRPFRAVTADTGHENELTYEWISKLSERTGGPKVEIVKSDFSKQIARKRELVQTKWVEQGVPDEIIRGALDVLHPTGNPFIDLCIWKGRFPSRMAQFCTEWLKAEPIKLQVFDPARSIGPVVSWQGERRNESANRAKLPRMSRIKEPGLSDLLIFRPILHWSAQNAFELHKHFGLDPNPLYRMGMRRETFFAASTTPQGKKLAQDHKLGLRLDEQLPCIDDIEVWSRTTRGGKQLDGLKLMESESLCSSQYGLCE